MAWHHAPSRAEPSSGKPECGSELGIEALAHELNTLLDGSLRSVELARRALKRDEPSPNIEQRLDTARTAMRSMATLLEEVMRQPRPGLELLSSDLTLAQEIDRQITVLQPLLDQHAINVITDVSDAIGGLRAGPLPVVLVNALRNAIQAIAAQGIERGEITVWAIDEEPGWVTLTVADTGPGLSGSIPPPPDGHGIGLTLCREIVHQLDGTMILEDRPDDCGARLEIRIPEEQLRTP